MNTFTFSAIIAMAIALLFSYSKAIADQPSEFDEAAIRTIQESHTMFQNFQSIAQAFEATNDPAVKAAKYEELVVAAAGGLLSSAWAAPSGGWKLVEFPATGNLTLEDIREQQSNKAYYTKLIAQNETQAVQFRGAQGLMLNAALESEQWAEKLLLDIAQRPDSNIKRLTYWSTKDFAIDWLIPGPAAAPPWPVDWNAWQQAYNAANGLGKAIILRNVTMLGIRREQVITAAAINLAALSGADRELKAIALAHGDPTLGSAVTAKWTEIAGNASDPQMQALAQEVRAKFGISN